MQFENILDANLKIFNRWGKVVYITSVGTDEWDGSGHATGVYFWMISYEGKNGKIGNAKGWVHLLK